MVIMNGHEVVVSEPPERVLLNVSHDECQAVGEFLTLNKD